MRWLIHSDITPAAAEAMKRHEQTIVSLADFSSSAPPAEVLTTAHQKQLDLLTADSKLVDFALSAQSTFNRSIVYLQLDGGDVEQDDAIDRLFARYPRLSPRRLYTVTATRVKVRQLPGGR